MEVKYKELKNRLMEASDLRATGAVLEWDQSTYMPAGGGEARARQSSLLARLAQEKATDPAIGRLLDELQPWADGLPYDSDEASLLRVARRDYERAVKVPPEFIGRITQVGSESYMAWAKARPDNDFAAVQPYLEHILDLCRELADFFPGYEHIADPLIDYSDYGMKASDVRKLFAELRQELLPVVQAITSQPPVDDSCLKASFPEAQQLAFGESVIRLLGYDYERGRLDKTPHPFTIKFSGGDVRITTRVQENDLGDCLFSTIHEAGHAMYEQGVRKDYDGTPLGNGTSAGVHESQSRLWENVVGRSWNFWDFFYPRLQASFPEQLTPVSLDTFYKAINKVQRSLIRTDADEVTYNLHVMIRFDLELALLEGKLAVRDLPDAWHARYESDLGVRAPDDRNGVMQDVHWYSGMIGGMFQGYTLGNILGAQFYQAALQAIPEIPDEMKEGKFDRLHTWLVENIYQHGRKFTANEVVQRVTGGGISIAPYMRYLKTKYGEMYNV